MECDRTKDPKNPQMMIVCPKDCSGHNHHHTHHFQHCHHQHHSQHHQYHCPIQYRSIAMLLSTLSTFLLISSFISLHVSAIPYPSSSASSSSSSQSSSLLITQTRPRLKPFQFDKNIIDGQSVRVFCQLLEGAQPLSFQWLKDDQPLPSSSSSNGALSSQHSQQYQQPHRQMSPLAHISIETYRDYSSLAIDRVDRHRDTGNYTCLVSNSFGSNQFSSILIVQEPPVFVEEPRDISIGLRKSTFLICRASSSHTKPVIKWNRILTDSLSSPMSIMLPSSQHSVVSTVSTILDKDVKREQILTGEQFHLTDARIEDAGIYECVAENPHNGLTISRSFTVTVNVPAYFEIKTDQMNVKRGETPKLLCETFGAKPVTIEWLKQNSRTLDFEPINLDYIQESYSYPRYTALEKHFDIYFDHRHHHSGSPASAANGINADTATANSYNNQINHNFKHMPYVNNNRTLFELHINSVTSTDTGQYACRARNDYGEDLRRITLFVQDVPAAVRQVQIDKIWSRDVSIRWLSPESIGNSPIIEYIVQYWKEIRITPEPSLSLAANQTSSLSLFSPTVSSGGHRLHEIKVSPTETHCTINNLTSGTSYVVRVIAVNNFGRGASSVSLRFITAEEAPNAAPIDIVAEQQDTATLRIRWKAPPKSHWNGQLRGYDLGYRLLSVESGGLDSGVSLSSANNVIDDSTVMLGKGSDQFLQSSIASAAVAAATTINNNHYIYKKLSFDGTSLDNYQEEYLLTGLNRASLYSIIIRAFNGIGEGPNSQEIFATTAANDPPPKPTIWIAQSKESSLVIKWEQKQSNTEVTHYIIYYKEEKRSSWMEISFARSIPNDVSADEETSDIHELAGLQRGTVYQIYMRSMGEKSAMSEPSDMIVARTEGEISLMNPNVNLESQQPYQLAPIPTSVYSGPSQGGQLLPTLATFQQQQVPPYLRLSFILPISIAVVVIVVACVFAYVYIRIDDRKAQMNALKSANNIYAGTVAIAPGKRFQYLSNNQPAHTMAHHGTMHHGSQASFASNAGLIMRDSNQSLVSEEGSLSFRYSDSSSEKGRPLLARPPGQTVVLWAQQQDPIMEEDEAIIEIDSSNAYETLPFQKNMIQNSNGFPPNTSTPMQSFCANSSGSSGYHQQQHHQPLMGDKSPMVKSPSFPPPPPPLPEASFPGAKSPRNSSNINNASANSSLNSSSASGHRPLNSTPNHPAASGGANSNIFCHVDVHHVQSSNASDANNSDCYDEFHFFSPAPQHV